MRSWIVNKIRLDPIIMTALGEGDPAAGPGKVLAAGAAGLPGQPDLLPPFLVIRALPVLDAIRGSDHHVDQEPYLIWVHDQQGSFEDVIGAVLTRLRSILEFDLPIRMPDGTVLMECVWQGDSSDLFDAGFSTATRYGQFQVTARRP